jgi:hypothetical protein
MLAESSARAVRRRRAVKRALLAKVEIDEHIAACMHGTCGPGHRNQSRQSCAKNSVVFACIAFPINMAQGLWPQ